MNICKKSLCALSVMLLSFSVIMFSGCSEDFPPIGIKTEDFTSCTGEEVEISGWGFSITPAENIVKFGTLPAEVVTATRNLLTVKVPLDATTDKITVEVKGNVAQGPVFTPAPAEYYIKFKANGVLKNFSVCLPTYTRGSTCVVGDAWKTENHNAVFQFCNDFDTVTPAVLQSWEGEQLFFAGSKPIVIFWYRENGGKEHRSDLAATTGMGWPENNSTLTITSLRADPNRDKVYIATGTFRCFVQATGSAPDEKAITEGEFQVPIALEL